MARFCVRRNQNRVPLSQRPPYSGSHDIRHTGVIFDTARRGAGGRLGLPLSFFADSPGQCRMVNYFSLPLTARRAFTPNVWDAVAFSLIIAGFVLVAHEARMTALPLAVIDTTPVSLEPANLPEYALRTMMRMLPAIVASLAFTLLYATLAAKSRRAALVMIPILDILQSVPVLGF